MDIKYTSKKLEKILTNPRLIKKNYSKFYQNIINRLSELRAANDLSQIQHEPPPRRHKLKGDRKDCWGVDVSKNYRIVLKPIDVLENQDPSAIRSIEILNIEDYH